jgi:6-pyruvoyl-tetrahydropterin synthase
MNAEKFYVIINDPITKEHEELVNKNIYEKVWTRKFYDILEIQGQIKSDGYDPKDPFFKDTIKGGITLGELRCLYNKELPTKENVQKQLKIRMESHNRRERFFNITGSNIINITYKETLLPNFYQTFNNKLSKLLT